jgi:hypothetical protein
MFLGLWILQSFIFTWRAHCMTPLWYLWLVNLTALPGPLSPVSQDPIGFVSAFDTSHHHSELRSSCLSQEQFSMALLIPPLLFVFYLLAYSTNISDKFCVWKSHCLWNSSHIQSTSNYFSSTSVWMKMLFLILLRAFGGQLPTKWDIYEVHGNGKWLFVFCLLFLKQGLTMLPRLALNSWA